MLAKRLKSLREERYILQKDVAKILNISTSAYGFYEQGERTPNAETIYKLADFFGVSTDYLLGRTDKRNPYEIQTIAAHHDSDVWTEEELEDIEKFKEFVKMKRQSKEDR